jgi:hypothetical protein
MPANLGDSLLDRMERAVLKVRERLLRATGALERARIPYAVVGGNAIAAWVARVDESAVRNTRDVDLLVRRDDFDSVTQALVAEGFIYRHSSGLDLFLDGTQAKARDGVHVVFAGERVRPEELLPNPDIDDAEALGPFRVLSLPGLVQIKLTAFRDKDRTHLRDLIDVGLVDASWPARFPPELAQRLQSLLDTPGG